MKAKDVITKIVEQGLPVEEFENFLDKMMAQLPTVTLIEIEEEFVSAGTDRATIIEMIENWQTKE